MVLGFGTGGYSDVCVCEHKTYNRFLTFSKQATKCVLNNTKNKEHKCFTSTTLQ